MDADLKKAIVRMPQGEKDKLLLRLIAKDDILVERLAFELVEHKETLDTRREIIKSAINRLAKSSYDWPGWAMMDMRSLSGDITRHVKVTKDAYGEVELQLHMLNSYFDEQTDLLRFYNSRSDKTAEYIAKRTEQLLKKLNKLNPDYYIDFELSVNRLLERVHAFCPAPYARQLQLPHEWVY